MLKEPCQCLDFRKLYKEYHGLIQEFPTFKDQQEINWTSIQSSRTLCSKVTEELQEELSKKDIKDKSVENNKHISDIEITDAIEEFENVNAYLYSIETLMERIFEIKVPKIYKFNLRKL